MVKGVVANFKGKSLLRQKSRSCRYQNVNESSQFDFKSDEDISSYVILYVCFSIFFRDKINADLYFRQVSLDRLQVLLNVIWRPRTLIICTRIDKGHLKDFLILGQDVGFVSRKRLLMELRTMRHELSPTGFFISIGRLRKAASHIRISRMSPLQNLIMGVVGPVGVRMRQMWIAFYRQWSRQCTIRVGPSHPLSPNGHYKERLIKDVKRAIVSPDVLWTPSQSPFRANGRVSDYNLKRSVN